MYKHLLIPIDGSELSKRASTEGLAFARSMGATVSFLYVQPEFPLPIAGEGAILSPESRDDFSKSTQAQADHILGEALAAAKAEGVIADSLTEVSDIPYQVIINTAQNKCCDLVFMASHGRKGLASLLLGSETHKVLTHCKIPVLVCR